MPSRQPTNNPLTLATIFYLELFAGAHSFFGIGALQVVPLPRAYPDDYPTCCEKDCESVTEFKLATADYNWPTTNSKLLNLAYYLPLPFCQLVLVWAGGGLPLGHDEALWPKLPHR